MKAKTNLELFKNEIVYGLKHGVYDTLYKAMVDIQKRETGEGTIYYEELLDWFSDVSRETLWLSAPVYDFIIEYSKIVQEKIWFTVDPIEDIFTMKALINLGIIPTKYAKYTMKGFIAIIRKKEDK